MWVTKSNFDSMCHCPTLEQLCGASKDSGASNTLLSVDLWTEDHHILAEKKEQILFIFDILNTNTHIEDIDRIMTCTNSRVCSHWPDWVDIHEQTASSDEDEDDDDDDSHDGVGLDNSSLQDLWPNIVVQFHPPPNAVCWAEEAQVWR